MGMTVDPNTYDPATTCPPSTEGQWCRPAFTDIRMDAEIGAYQGDDGTDPD